MNIFVFGSNEAGRHGAGAALTAQKHHGAIYGQGWGLQGKSFGIPTKNKNLQVLNIEEVRRYAEAFKLFAQYHKWYTFKVTRIGCGLAGFEDKDIAPMFANAPTNCKFSSLWAKWLPNHESWTDR